MPSRLKRNNKSISSGASTNIVLGVHPLQPVLKTLKLIDSDVIALLGRRGGQRTQPEVEESFRVTRRRKLTSTQ